MITLEEIYELYKNLENREMGDSYICDFKGKRVKTDVSYAIDGIIFFIKEIEHKIKEKGDVKNENNVLWITGIS